MNNSNKILRDEIYSTILEAILNCEYKPDQIINEQELAEKFNCSKSPIREALAALCNDNILKNIPRCGYEVVRLTREDVEDMIQLRYILEAGMVLSCIDSITIVQIENLKKLDAVSTENDDVWTRWENNSNFHLQLSAYAQNSIAYYELKRIMSRLKRAYAQFYWGKWDASADLVDSKSHSQILSYLREKDARGAIKALKNDIASFGHFSCNIVDVYERFCY